MMRYNSGRVVVFRLLRMYISIIPDDIAMQILELVSSEPYKLKVVSLIAPFLELSDDRSAEVLVSNIRSDSSKVECIKLIIPKMKVDPASVIPVLGEISSDSSILQALYIFIESGLKINYDELFDILDTLGSNDSKVDAILLLFDNIVGKISDHEKYCQKLATAINSEGQYLKVAKKFQLNSESIKKA
jgi:hypothetical protein